MYKAAMVWCMSIVAVSTMHGGDIVRDTWLLRCAGFSFLLASPPPAPRGLWARIIKSRKHAAVFVASGFQRTASSLISGVETRM